MAVVDFYDLDPHQLSLLISACEAKDRSERCRAAIAVEGATTADRWGQLKPHPLLAVEAVARGQFYLGYRALGLDVMPTGNVGRPRVVGGR
jgi:hypothetical protein